MAIFNSYVSLPEGIHLWYDPPSNVLFYRSQGFSNLSALPMSWPFEVLRDDVASMEAQSWATPAKKIKYPPVI